MQFDDVKMSSKQTRETSDYETYDERCPKQGIS